LRINDLNGAWRVIDWVDADAILIVEVFQKQKNQMPQQVVETRKQRLRRCGADSTGCGERMDEKQRQMLEQKGWKSGSVQEFLDLTPEEASYIELKLALGDLLREHRQTRRMTQADLARLLKSSQSRVAKMEGGDPTVSLDLLVRSLLVLGATRQNLAQIIASHA